MGEDPLRGSLRGGVSGGERRSLAPVLAETHGHQLRHDGRVGLHGRLRLASRARPRSSSSFVRIRGGELLLSRREPRRPNALDVDSLRHGHQDVELLRGPVLGDVVPSDLDREDRRHGLEPRAFRRDALASQGGGVKIIHRLIRGEGGQARVKRDDGPRGLADRVIVPVALPLSPLSVFCRFNSRSRAKSSLFVANSTGTSRGSTFSRRVTYRTLPDSTHATRSSTSNSN